MCDDRLESIRYDAIQDQCASAMIHIKEMEILKLKQPIYLFVEGDTEEATYPELLAKCDLDIDDLAVVMANYGGAGNLIHCVRLLKKTLSFDRPVIITIDNDEEGHRCLSRLERQKINKDLITLLPLPSTNPPVELSEGRKRGHSYRFLSS